MGGSDQKYDQSPQYDITLFRFSTKIGESDINLTLRFNHKLFHVSVSASQLCDSPDIATRYLNLVETFNANQDDDSDHYEALCEWIVAPLIPLLEKMAPSDMAKKPSTLYEYYHPESFSYILQVSDGRLVPQLMQDTFKMHGIGMHIFDLKLTSLWPSYSLHEVFMHDDNSCDPSLFNPRKVVTKGSTVRFFKELLIASPRAVATELETYAAIQRSNLGQDTQITRCHGTVYDGDGFVVGLLITYIDCENLTLRCAVPEQASLPVKKRWARQIVDTLAALHEAGVVWGDVKPENILVDSTQKVWISDFGGSYTQGWVDKQIAGTKDGDLQGLINIMAFLFSTKALD